MNNQDIAQKQAQNNQKQPYLNEQNTIEVNYPIPYQYSFIPAPYISPSQIISFPPVQYAYLNYQNNQQYEYGNMHHIYSIPVIQNNQNSQFQTQQFNSYSDRPYQLQTQPAHLYAVYPSEMYNQQFHPINQLDLSKNQNNKRDNGMCGQVLQNGENNKQQQQQQNFQESNSFFKQNDLDKRRSSNLSQKEDPLNNKIIYNSAPLSFMNTINSQQNNEFNNNQKLCQNQQEISCFKTVEIQQEEISTKQIMIPSNYSAVESLQNKGKQDQNHQQINFKIKDEDDGIVKDQIIKKLKVSNIKNLPSGLFDQNEKYSQSGISKKLNQDCQIEQYNLTEDEKYSRQYQQKEQINCDKYDQIGQDIKIDQMQFQNSKNLLGKNNEIFYEKGHKTPKKSSKGNQQNKKYVRKCEDNDLKQNQTNIVTHNEINDQKLLKSQLMNNSIIQEKNNHKSSEQTLQSMQINLQMKEENETNQSIIVKNEQIDFSMSNDKLNDRLMSDAGQLLEKERQREQISELINSQINNKQSSLDNFLNFQSQECMNEERFEQQQHEIKEEQSLEENNPQQQKQDQLNINKYKYEILKRVNIEEFNLIKNALSINKQNPNKNIIKAFQKYVNNTQKDLYEYKKESKKDYYYKICQHEQIVKIEDPSQKERTQFFKKFNKFIANKTYTNSNIKQIIQNRIYGQILFSDFLNQQAYDWLEQANVINKDQYKLIIDFYKLCCTNQDILVFLSDSNSIQNFSSYMSFPNIKNKALMTEYQQNIDNTKDEEVNKQNEQQDNN